MIRPSLYAIFFHFGLIVTGETEQAHLPKLFRALMSTHLCTFTVLRLAKQRNPITSARRKLKIVGSEGGIPSKDKEDIGFPARRYLQENRCHLVVLIDDLEDSRRSQAQGVFDRYRLALDTILTPKQRTRAAVHLFVTMLEAYYLADAAAVNAVLPMAVPWQDYHGDVEEIPHPKADLHNWCPAFKEIEHGGAILAKLNMEQVLTRPKTCAWLRTLFAWGINILQQCPGYEASGFSAARFCLHNGRFSDITKVQLAQP